MRTTIITLITSFILLIPASGQGQWGSQIQWEIVDVEFENSMADQENVLSDVLFIERDKGYIVLYDVIHSTMAEGFLYMTEDGGKTWNLIFDDIGVITSIQFVNESIAFATNNLFGGGGMLSSSDGGYSWSEDTTIDQIQDIFFLNDSIGWAGGEGILKTINGGESWNKESDIEVKHKIYSLFFIDDSTGWAVGESGLIAKYTLFDGWKTIHGVTDLPLKKVFFVDRDNGWIAGGYNNNDALIPILLKTMDGGETWNQITDMNYMISDFYFDTKNHGWAVGEDSGERGVILETFNGGLDMDLIKEIRNKKLNALHFKDGIGWAVGNFGLILTNDSTIFEKKEINIDNESLFQNYPNPFQTSTIITYQLPATSEVMLFKKLEVELSVYDISGREVGTLVNDRQLADRYEVEWNAEGMESGIYFCELKTGQGRQVMKMVLID